ncbi:MAG: hypothetical protein ABUS57_02555 [Pseudomonadota bacterium]
MHVHPYAAQANKPADPRDQATSQNRADLPQSPPKRSVEFGGALSHLNEEPESAVDPSGVHDKTRRRSDKKRLVDVFA